MTDFTTIIAMFSLPLNAILLIAYAQTYADLRAAERETPRRDRKTGRFIKRRR